MAAAAEGSFLQRQLPGDPDRWITKDDQEKIKMSSLLDMAEEIGMRQGIEQGMKKGMERGIKQGRTLERRKLVTRLMSRGYSEEEIMALTDMTPTELESYRGGN